MCSSGQSIASASGAGEWRVGGGGVWREDAEREVSVDANECRVDADGVGDGGGGDGQIGRPWGRL